MSTSTDLFTLSKAFLKAGYAATSTVENAMQVMDMVQVRNEDAIARVLAVMVRTHSDLEPSADGQRTWQVDNFVEAIRQQDPSINWTTVLCKLDHPEFTLYNLAGLKMIVDTWNASQKHNPTPEEFPLQVFFYHGKMCVVSSVFYIKCYAVLPSYLIWPIILVSPALFDLFISWP